MAAKAAKAKVAAMAARDRAMDDESGGGPAAAPGPGGEALAEAAVERRLRSLSTACAVPAAAALAASGAIVWTASEPGAEGWLGSPPGPSFLMALGALVLVLLSSAAYTRIVRRAREEGVGERGAVTPAGVSGWLSVYSRATGVSFAMLAAAAALGAAVALRGRAPFYGLVICLASLLCMAVRWPRRAGLAVAMDGPAPAP
jgi:hypothetical protein